jgi:hypothetical protein BACCOPRO_00718
MKKILVNYTGRTKAGPVYSYEMTKGLLENGAEVYAIISAQADNITDWRALPLAKLVEIDTYTNKVEFVFRTIRFFFLRKRILREMYKVQFDAIYCPMATLWSRLINRMFSRVPLYFTLHDPKPHSGEQTLNKWLMRYNTAAEVGRAQKIIVLSETFINDIGMYYGRAAEDVLVIPHGAFDYARKAISNEVPLFETDAEITTFLFFGRIEQYKGIDVLIEAYRDIECSGERVQLVIAGEGDFSPYQEQFDELQSAVLINRNIKDEEVSSLFSGQNIVTVLPYRDATQSGVVNIAAGHRSLVIATEAGGLPEQLGYGEYGILIPPNDIEALRLALLGVLRDREKYKKTIESAYCAWKELSWKNLAGKILSSI